MNLTNKQSKDLETINYLNNIDKGDYTGQDIKIFFDFSEKGIRPEVETVGFKTLKEGKRWRGIHMEMYEEGVLDGSTPYRILLESVPESVKDFMKREMFKGIDADIIERVWRLI